MGKVTWRVASSASLIQEDAIETRITLVTNLIVKRKFTFDEAIPVDAARVG